MAGFFVTGTDTDIGKTLASSWLLLHVNGFYWKPVQSGVPKDRDTVQAITELPDDRFLPSAYELSQPLSPHEAAKRDGVEIDMAKFMLPQTDRPLIVEGAGGLMVPLNKDKLVIDLIKLLDLPVILVCRSGLGTINHTLLSLEAMNTRGIDVAGIIMCGPKSPHNREALEEYGKTPILVEIDQLDTVSKEMLLEIKPEFEL